MLKLPDVVVPEDAKLGGGLGRAGTKRIDPKELTPQFILFFTICFIVEYNASPFWTH